MDLVGRHHETARLHLLLDGIRERGAALVLTGEPGIGKTALLRQAAGAARARGLTVLGTAGIEAEAHLPYAALHKLLWPMRATFHELPAPQLDALESALGISEPRTPQSYLVALAVMNLLADSAERTPLALIADDTHWLDSPTGEVLAFLARRIEAEPIVLLATARTGSASALVTAGVPALTVEPLSDDSAESLLAQQGRAVPSWLRHRVLLEASGNPLALIELLAATELNPPDALNGPWLPLSARLEDGYAARVARLPAATRSILDVAALDDSSDLGEVLRVTSRLLGAGVGDGELQPAVDAHLVQRRGTWLSFHHPLVRSAIHQRMTVEQRRAVHRALAEELGAEPDRRAWHLAESVDGHDEDVAVELERVADRARRSGRAETVAHALERAAQLTVDPRRRADRLLGAAESAAELAHPEVIVRLLNAIAQLELDGPQRARLLWVRAACDDGLRDPVFTASELAELADSVNAEGHVDLATRILWSAALRCFWTEPGASARARIVEVAEALPVDPMDPRLVCILGYAAPVIRGAVVIERIERLLGSGSLDPSSRRLIGSVAALVGRLDIAIAQSSAAVAGLREQGQLQLLARALAAQAWSAAQLADLELAMPAAEESDLLAEETGQTFLHGLMLATKARIAALRGEPARVAELAAEAEQIAVPVGARNVLAAAQHARALAALGEGDYAQALSRMLRMHEPTAESRQLALKYQTLTDIADAAVHSRQIDRALPMLAEMEQAGTLTPSNSLHDSLRLARALLGPGGDAEARFTAALAADLSMRPFMRARTELAYGEWLRHERRTLESRDYLRSACETFDALGVVPFGDRARHELRAAGERGPERQLFPADVLTAQEMQVAQLAAAGLTNKEIGARLYLSHRTVGAHLARIFTKLGVTSRVQLHAAVE